MPNWLNERKDWGWNSPYRVPAQRLQEDITEQIASLQDIAEAMDEVYMRRRS